MAAALRLGWRQIRSPWRRMGSTLTNEFAEEEAHALKTTVTWRKISMFVALPGVALAAYNSITKELAHMKHVKEHGRAEFTAYPHLRLRNKPWPWGDGNHSLVHNPDVNALPDGYED